MLGPISKPLGSLGFLISIMEMKSLLHRRKHTRRLVSLLENKYKMHLAQEPTHSRCLITLLPNWANRHLICVSQQAAGPANAEDTNGHCDGASLIPVSVFGLCFCLSCLPPPLHFLPVIYFFGTQRAALDDCGRRNTDTRHPCCHAALMEVTLTPFKPGMNALLAWSQGTSQGLLTTSHLVFQAPSSFPPENPSQFNPTLSPRSHSHQLQHVAAILPQFENGWKIPTYSHDETGLM